MKKVVILAVAVFAAGCWRARTIPDETLADIFRDMYIANAYVDENAVEFGTRRGYVEGYIGSYQNGYGSGGMMPIDSINIYEPIMRHYGYRSRDFIHTLASFSKRKSAKVGDIIDRAIEKLTAELDGYSALIARREQMDSVAYENTHDTVARWVSIKAHTVADTAKLRLTYPAQDGHYRIEYSYMLDTLDKNFGLRATHYLRDSNRMVVAQNTYIIFRGARTSRSFTLNSTPAARTLELKLGNYAGDKITRPNFEVDSILIIHYPPQEVARRIYLNRLLRFEPDSIRYEPLH